MDEEDAIDPADAVVAMVREDWEDRYKRPRGMLTDTDRKFLWGVTEYKHGQTATNRRADIRERVENGILDLFYLTMIEQKDRDSILTELDEHSEAGDLRSAIASLTSFLYLGLDADVEWFEETLSHGIGRAEHDLRDDDRTFYTGATVDAGVKVDITVTHGYDVDRIEEQFREGAGNALTPAEVGVLVRTGRVDSDDLEELDFTTGGLFPENPVTDAPSRRDG